MPSGTSLAGDRPAAGGPELLEELTKPAFENESGEIKPVLMLVRHSVGILEGSHWGKIHS